MRILATGISGFVGSHLAEYVCSNLQNVEIYGLVRPRSSLQNLRKVIDKVKLIEGDLRDSTSVLNILDEIRPDRIFHLAGQSAVKASFDLPAETFLINALGTINLFEALRELHLNPRILIAGAAQAYGLTSTDELPMKETSFFRPLSPLAVSKAAQDLLGFQYFKNYGLKTIRVRMFNALGPRQPEYHFASSLAKQIAEIEKKKRTAVLFVGNLETKRDYTDVRDLVRGLWLISEKGDEGEVYNLGSGQCWAGNEILKAMLAMTRAKVVVEVEEKRLRPSDPPILLADITRVNKLTGWKPQINLKQSLLDLLNYWREAV